VRARGRWIQRALDSHRYSLREDSPRTIQRRDKVGGSKDSRTRVCRVPIGQIKTGLVGAGTRHVNDSSSSGWQGAEREEGP
jgi:hypothetical protein